LAGRKRAAGQTYAKSGHAMQQGESFNPHGRFLDFRAKSMFSRAFVAHDCPRPD